MSKSWNVLFSQCVRNDEPSGHLMTWFVMNQSLRIYFDVPFGSSDEVFRESGIWFKF